MLFRMVGAALETLLCQVRKQVLISLAWQFA
jgi:hypothetical protein